MGRSIDYFAPVLPFDGLKPVALCNVLGSVVPLMLDAIERRKGYVHWADRGIAAEAYNELSRQQWELIMDAKEDIIREIRHARGSIPVGAETTLEAFPVGQFPGIQLADIVGSLNTNGRSAAAILDSIETILETQSAGETGQLDALLQIVALLSV